MGCVTGKTGHTDTSETESTISTVSYRGKSLPDDDYWAKQEIKEEKEIEAELEGKRIHSRKGKKDKVQFPEKVANQVDLNKGKRTESSRDEKSKSTEAIKNVDNFVNQDSLKNDKVLTSEKNIKDSENVKKGKTGNASETEKDKVAKKFERHSAKGKERQTGAESKNGVAVKNQNNTPSDEANGDGKLNKESDKTEGNKEKDNIDIGNVMTSEKQNNIDNKRQEKEGSEEKLDIDENPTIDVFQEDDIDSYIKVPEVNKETLKSAKDNTLEDNTEAQTMGNTESKDDNVLNGHVEEQSEYHHVRWKDESKGKNGANKKDVDLKLMPQPSDRVMSAHARPRSAKLSAGRERKMSARMSARGSRRGSAKHSASTGRRERKSVDETAKNSIGQTEQNMNADKNASQDGNEPPIKEESADNYADVEQMIRDEPEKEEEEEDTIDSFDDDEISASQMTDRAPSLSLWYDDNVFGDILTTQVYVPSFGLTRYTYYCCLQWNSGKNGGGYCGLQDHENGRNYIFSIWDPVDGEGTIKPVYIGPGTTCEAFGGEGTGLKSWNFDLGWEPDCWYTLVTRRWDHEGHTRYGFWVKHHLECFWTHIVTVDFPLPAIYFDTWTCSFIEDWEGSGHRVRRAHLRNGFKRKPNSEWVPFDKAVLGMVKETSSRRYRGNFDAGTFDEMFFLQSGGESLPSEGISEGTCFYTVSDDKPTEVTISCVLTTVTGTEMVWEVSEGSVPQFRYAIKVDGELYKQEINSEMRVCKFDTPPKQLVEIFVEDILGRTASAKFEVREKLKVKANGDKLDR